MYGALELSMRLPDIERDFWELRSGEADHQAHPNTFWIPPIDARQNLKRGQGAKLMFDIKAENEQGNFTGYSRISS